MIVTFGEDVAYPGEYLIYTPRATKAGTRFNRCFVPFHYYHRLSLLKMSGFSLEALIPPAWATVLKEELRKDYFTALAAKVAEAYEGELPVYPPQHQIFRALELCAPEDVKVIILGQVIERPSYYTRANPLIKF